MIVPIFLTDLGCATNKCIYCSQKIASSEPSVVDCNNFGNDKAIYARITDSMQKYILDKKEIIFPLEIAIYASNFTAIPFKQQKDIILFIQKEFDRITGHSYKKDLLLRISTNPTFIKKHELLDLKLRFNLSIVEIGVQSMDNDVLALNNRDYDKDKVIEACQIIKDLGLKLSCHQMIGMYNSSFSLDKMTAREIVKLKPDFVRMHPTLVLKETVLEKLYLSGEYYPLNLDKAVEQTASLLSIYRVSGVKVTRIGLHPSELLVDNIVAGPWHPSLRELVEGKFLKEIAFDKLSQIDSRNVIFKISPKDETYFRGKNNVIYQELIDTFRLEDVKILKDDHVSRGDLVIENMISWY